MRGAAFCLLILLITACGTAAPPGPVITAAGPVPSPPGVTTGTAALQGSSAVNASPACVASLRPSGPLPAPGRMPAGSTMAAIYQRGYLVVGVDQTTPLLSYRDPATGQRGARPVRVDGPRDR